MPSIELTENLRSTIRDLRKKKKKRGDELSKELGKGASYISQIENGKIKEIDFDLLDQIFHKITDLSDSQYNEFIKNLLDTAASHMTNEELQYEKWMHQFNYEIRKYPITDELISFIRDKLAELHCTPRDFVSIINTNRGLEGANIEETNKLYIDIIDTGNGTWGVFTSIKFDLPSDLIENILNKKTTSINYVNMQGILYNIFISEGCTQQEAHKKSDALLDENKFYTIQKRNKLIHDSIKEKTSNKEDFTFYDVQPTDYDKKYEKLKHDITSGFNALRDKNILYTCERLDELLKNMKYDLGLVIAVMSAPIHKIDSTKKEEFWNDYKDLLSKYVPQKDTNQ